MPATLNIRANDFETLNPKPQMLTILKNPKFDHQKIKNRAKKSKIDPKIKNLTQKTQKSIPKNPKTLKTKNRFPKNQNSIFGPLKNVVLKRPTKKDQKHVSKEGL